ncbi:MAG: methyltransferase domain-containing protein [Candidatus Lokiarchaeota archaeon]|nr:methyltransferase domain-containing protein [Candidatus Lokiarchaeota archaeon]
MMKEKIYIDKEFWEDIYSSEEYFMKDMEINEGNDGEDEFETKVFHIIKEKTVLDVGCGEGYFSLKMAECARKVVGIDFSDKAISLSQINLFLSKKANVKFCIADASMLPFTEETFDVTEETFDVIISRREPVTATTKTLTEAYRVLNKGGSLIEITIGEHDKISLKEVFGRGQLYGIKGKVADLKRRMLEADFRFIKIKEYKAFEIFQNLDDLIIKLETTPIIFDFDAHQDKKYLNQIRETYMTNTGIKTEIHRLIIIARK